MNHQLYNLSSITGLITWLLIMGAYLRFYYGMKAQGLSRDDLPYKAPFQPWASWVGFIFFFIVVSPSPFPCFHLALGGHTLTSYHVICLNRSG